MARARSEEFERQTCSLPKSMFQNSADLSGVSQTCVCVRETLRLRYVRVGVSALNGQKTET